LWPSNSAFPNPTFNIPRWFNLPPDPLLHTFNPTHNIPTLLRTFLLPLHHFPRLITSPILLQILFKRDGTFLNCVGNRKVPHVSDLPCAVGLPQTHQVSVVGHVPRVLLRVRAGEQAVARLVDEVQGLTDRGHTVIVSYEGVLTVVQCGAEERDIVVLLEKEDQGTGFVFFNVIVPSLKH
jgi:hypothetical protein